MFMVGSMLVSYRTVLVGFKIAELTCWSFRFRRGQRGTTDWRCSSCWRRRSRRCKDKLWRPWKVKRFLL